MLCSGGIVIIVGHVILHIRVWILKFIMCMMIMFISVIMMSISTHGGNGILTIMIMITITSIAMTVTMTVQIDIHHPIAIKKIAPRSCNNRPNTIPMPNTRLTMNTLMRGPNLISNLGRQSMELRLDSLK